MGLRSGHAIFFLFKYKNSKSEEPFSIRNHNPLGLKLYKDVKKHFVTFL